MKVQKVYNIKYAMAMTTKGHKIIFSCPNPQKPDFIMWFFEKTPEFEKDWEELRNGNK